MVHGRDRGHVSCAALLACAALQCCVSPGSASGAAAAIAIASKCADASAAVMLNMTNGAVASCAVAKAVHLCQRDPQTAERRCPVTCALGCAGPDSDSSASLWTLPVASPCADVLVRLGAIHEACALSPNGTVCALPCATELVKFARNASCMSYVDRILDVDGPDMREDGNASNFHHYVRVCKAHQCGPGRNRNTHTALKLWHIYVVHMHR